LLHRDEVILVFNKHLLIKVGIAKYARYCPAFLAGTAAGRGHPHDVGEEEIMCLHDALE
jgi:hypothetical protein